jgi:hypothetical protein
MVFNEASKVDVGTPVRMKGVQIGNIASVALHASHVEAVAQVADASNIIPQVSAAHTSAMPCILQMAEQWLWHGLLAVAVAWAASSGCGMGW